MINKIFGTVASRVFNALLSLGILIIASKQLGAERLGTISLIILGITIVQMVNNFIGGAALVYLIPRFNVFQLIIPSYVWAFATAAVCTSILNLLNLIPHEYFYHVMFLSVIQSLCSINLTLLLGKERVKEYNIISSSQIILMILVLCIMVFYYKEKTVTSYLIALYVSWGLGMLAGFIASVRFIKVSNFKNFREVLKNILRFGTYVQLANIIQLFNYRLCYYFIESFAGRAALGIYSAGVQLSEGLWLTGKSMAIVQYSRISNTNDKEYSRKITLVFGKISVLVTLVLLIVLILIPHQLFSSLFGKDFSMLPLVILSLSAGILFFSMTFAFSHYFSGIGKHYHNSISSAIGIAFTVVLGYILIPRYGLAGAGITTSAAYFSILIYQTFFFLKISGTKIKELLITKKDITMFVAELKNWLSSIKPGRKD